MGNGICTMAMISAIYANEYKQCSMMIFTNMGDAYIGYLPNSANAPMNILMKTIGFTAQYRK